MDAGVLPLHVFPHEPSRELTRLLKEGDRIEPTLTPGGLLRRSEPVSLIVPTFFNDSMKQRSLARLLAGIERSRVVQEIVLVLASDSESDVQFVQPLLDGKRLVHVRTAANQRARTRNAGVEAATHDMLLFLDDDMLPRDWAVIDVIVSELLAEEFDCALFPRRHYAQFPLLFDSQALTSAIDDWRSDETELDRSIVYDPVEHGCPFKMMAFCFPGCFTLIRRAAFEQIGGFPEDYQGWGFEDTVFAMRATSQLRVLNLFRRANALLHIDHPVSPYKSAEYGENYRKFYRTYNPLDVDWLCSRIISGDDFRPQGATSHHDYLVPLQSVAKTYQIPMVMEEVEACYRQVIRMRLDSGQQPIPQFIVLHGSRGRGVAEVDSDFDVAVLFRGGPLREFFVCQQKPFAPVELEFTDLATFEAIAARPAHFPLNGPLELAKLAQSVLLWGDRQAWEDWVNPLLRKALHNGRELWLLFGMGMCLRPNKVGALLDHFFSAIRMVMVRAGDEVFQPDIECLDDPRPEKLGARLRTLLDANLPCWRDELVHGKRLFAFQVPEVWTALRWIMQNT